MPHVSMFTEALFVVSRTRTSPEVHHQESGGTVVCVYRGYFLLIQVYTSDTHSNINGSHLLCWVKEARRKRVHSLWLKLHEVPEEFKQNYDKRNQTASGGCLGRDRGTFWGRGHLLSPMWVPWVNAFVKRERAAICNDVSIKCFLKEKQTQTCVHISSNGWGMWPNNNFSGKTGSNLCNISSICLFNSSRPAPAVLQTLFQDLGDHSAVGTYSPGAGSQPEDGLPSGGWAPRLRLGGRLWWHPGCSPGTAGLIPAEQRPWLWPRGLHDDALTALQPTIQKPELYFHHG